MSDTSAGTYFPGAPLEPDYAHTGGDAWVDPDVDRVAGAPQFEGDVGELDPGQRRLLVVLLKNRLITSGSHPEEWRALVADPGRIRARLNDMFLVLHLDTDREVAFKVQATADTGTRFPTLLRATEWTREETILLVHLRQVAHAGFGAGEDKIYVDREDLLEHLAQMRPAHLTNLPPERDRTTRAVESLVGAGVLLGRKDGDRFEISRAVEALLPLELLKRLLGWITVAGATPAIEPASSAGQLAESAPTSEVTT